MNNASRWLLMKDLNLFGVKIYNQASVESVSASGMVLKQGINP